jgi:caffeoyl-CoA O-methyltransferase
MKLKYISLNDRLYCYVCACRSDAGDPILEALQAATESLGDISRMQISREQGSFMTLLTAAIGAKSAIEVGTFTGYSSLCIARGLAPRGRLICVDQSEEWTSIARQFWQRAGVENKIELRLGPAVATLKKLDRHLRFDFAFIDADKTEYDAYYELILPRIRQNGLILFDNMLWGGRLGTGRILQASGKAIEKLNRKLARDKRVESVLLPIADGIHLCRKR